MASALSRLHPQPAVMPLVTMAWQCLAACTYVLLPALMAWAWISYMAAQCHWHIYEPGMMTALFGVSCVYCFDRFIDPDKRAEAFQLGSQRLLCGLASGLFAIVALVYVLIWNQSQWLEVLLCVALCVVHAFTKKIPLAKTFMITLCWFVACCILPFQFEHVWLHVQSAGLLHLGLWFVLFAIACVLCDVKDYERDQQAGIPTMPLLMGVKQSRKCCFVVLFICLLLAGFFQLWPLFLLSAMLLLLERQQSVLRHPLWAVVAIDGALTVSAFLGACAFY